MYHSFHVAVALVLAAVSSVPTSLETPITTSSSSDTIQCTCGADFNGWAVTPATCEECSVILVSEAPVDGDCGTYPQCDPVPNAHCNSNISYGVVCGTEEPTIVSLSFSITCSKTQFNRGSATINCPDSHGGGGLWVVSSHCHPCDDYSQH